MPDRPTARQRDAWLLAAMTVPAVALCAGIGWQWALLGGAISAALYLIQGRARQSGLALRDAVNEAFGTAGGTMIMVLAAIWNLFALAWLTQRADGAFPEAKDSVAVGLILLALAAFAAWKGEDVAARCAGVIALVLAGLYALLFCAAIGDVQLEWLRPWGGWRRSVLPVACLLLPCAAWYLGAEKEACGTKEHGVLLLLAPALAAAATAGCLSPRLAAMEEAPFYEMVKGLSLFTVVERFEPLASTALALGYFCAMSLLLCAARACFGGKRAPWQLAALAALAGAGSFWAGRIPTAAFAAGAAIFWGLLPLLIPLVVDHKKGGKKSKIMLDKSDPV